MRAAWFCAFLLGVLVIVTGAGVSQSATGSDREALKGPVTLVTAKDEILGFAQDGDRLAWMVADGRSEIGTFGSVYEQVVGGGPVALLVKQDDSSYRRDFAFAGTQAIWTTWQAGNNLYTQVTTGEPGMKPKPLEHELPETGGMYFDALGDGSFPGAVAGDGSVLVYSAIGVGFVDQTCTPEEENCDRSAGGATYLVAHGRKREVKGAGGAVALAAAAPNIAIVPVAASTYVDPMGDVDGRIVAPTAKTISVRNARTGRLVSSFDPTGTPRAVALTPWIVAVLVDQPKTKRIEVRAVKSGKLLRAVPVPRGTTNAISATDRVIVYAVNRDPESFHSSPHDIYALDTSTYKTRRLIRTAYTPVGLSVEGSRVAWAVSAPRFAAIKAIYLK